jgi:hypothetical protein
VTTLRSWRLAYEEHGEAALARPLGWGDRPGLPEPEQELVGEGLPGATADRTDARVGFGAGGGMPARRAG